MGYEAILQLRGPYEDAFHALVKKDPPISECKEKKEGLDVYLDSRKYAVKAAKELHREFGGELKLTTKLYSRDRHTGKLIHRVTILLRVPGFGQGDMVSFKGSLYIVRTINGKWLKGTDIMTGKDRSLSIADVKIAAKKSEYVKAVVSRRKPSLNVLHPETFESVPVENPISTRAKKLEIALIKGRIYLVLP